MSKQLYIAGDYAGLQAGPFKFYYGYEKTVCKDHAEEDCQNCEWAFTAELNGQELMRFGKSALKAGSDEVTDNLIAGLGMFIQLRELKR